MLSRYQENILKYANITNDTKQIAKLTKETELKVQSTILTLARKNYLSKDKAKALLKDTQMLKLIDTPISSGLSKPLNLKSDRYTSTPL